MKNIFKKDLSKLSLLATVLLAPLTFSHATVTNVIVHENASGKNVDGWHIYDNWPRGSKIENVKDSQRGLVIKFTGTTSNGVSLLGWEDNNNLIQWKMKANKFNSFYVVIQTTKGFRYLTYSPRSYDKGRGTKQKYKIRFGLGSKMKDGKWHTFTRDIEADLKKFEPDNEYLYMKGIKFRGAGSFDDIKTMKQKRASSTDKKEIFIIGPSTVHIGKEWNSNRTGVCGDDNPENILMGWGEKFQDHSKNRVYDFARLGSNPLTFFDGDYNTSLFGINQNWDSAYSAMRKATKGGFLLIQFGGNSKHLTSEQFKTKIREYIAKAKELNIIPVLISSVNRHNINNKLRGGVEQQYMRQLAASDNILYLDLRQKTHEEFLKLNAEELDKFGDCIFQGKREKDVVHLSPHGADVVASWVKDLACESNRSDGKELCSQLK